MKVIIQNVSMLKRVMDGIREVIKQTTMETIQEAVSLTNPKNIAVFRSLDTPKKILEWLEIQTSGDAAKVDVNIDNLVEAIQATVNFYNNHPNTRVVSQLDTMHKTRFNSDLDLQATFWRATMEELYCDPNITHLKCIWDNIGLAQLRPSTEVIAYRIGFYVDEGPKSVLRNIHYGVIVKHLDVVLPLLPLDWDKEN